MNVNEAVAALAEYGIRTGLMSGDDRIYAENRILNVMKLDDYKRPGTIAEAALPEILNVLLDDAAARGLTENSVVYRDLFDTELMNCLMPRPSDVRRTFEALYRESPEKATDYFYKLSQDSNYIRRDRVARDLKWKTASAYGDLDITINLSKPEKDPKAIAAARTMKQSGYPKCLLCKENVGYHGRVNHPGRANHRVIPLTLDGQPWFMQYSPYVYYNEHCIVFNAEHTPMKISKGSFRRLLQFVTMFPHYFIGSNADLPIVGGSILTHDHFQGGRYTFAMARAPIETPFVFPGYEDVESGIVKWPMSVIRIRSGNTERLADLADHILSAWRKYTDESAFIFAETDGEPHNTITPIARFADGKFELDLVLRNNITTQEHPLGVFHPHEELHHIKKENIGLIEVMGLAVLPARLKTELAVLKEAILSGSSLREDDRIAKHADWAEEFLKKYDCVNEQNIDRILQKEVGLVFARVLEDAGVYKSTPEGREAFLRFLRTL
ncbi:MAG: UDP-glucose--hexose-1-phosphate uridylyltransferase [Lachnospiraceae bacterium]|jgi:UDPglucose--hexose-1-phosphate uridylyltransferase